jgi:putative spermidine/putrescine transport system substrate-binding protein
MRRFLGVIFVLILGLSFGMTSAFSESLTVVSWGGSYTHSQEKAYHEPFTSETGIKVLSENYNGGLAEIKTQVETGTVTWDVVDVELSDALRGCDEGLLEPLDTLALPPAPDGTPASSDFMEEAITECAVGTIVWSTIYAYNEKSFPGAKPSTIADLFDTKKFPGKRGFRKGPKVTLEMALMADGVSPNQVYAVLSTEAGLKRAFAKLDSIRDDIVWWESGSQPPQLLADGEVAMSTAYNGRIFNAVVVEDQPFTIVWDGQIQDLDLWVIPRGGKNVEAAKRFVAFSTTTKALADQAKYIAYGPVRMSSIPQVGRHADSGVDMKPHMPTSPANTKNALFNDVFFWADFSEELNQRFASWLAK